MLIQAHSHQARIAIRTELAIASGANPPFLIPLWWANNISSFSKDLFVLNIFFIHKQKFHCATFFCSPGLKVDEKQDDVLIGRKEARNKTSTDHDAVEDKPKQMPRK